MELGTSQNQSTDRKKWDCSQQPFSAGRLALVAALLAGLAANKASAQEQECAEREAQTEADGERRVLFIRPHAGVGWAAGYNRLGDALALHAGGRILFPAPISPKVEATFGLEATYLQLDITGRDIFSERYAAVGVVLELTVAGGFNLGIGTLGYVGVGETNRNPFGVVTNLGWEPAWESRVRPYITLRTEWVFDQATYNVLSLSVGVTFGI